MVVPLRLHRRSQPPSPPFLAALLATTTALDVFSNAQTMKRSTLEQDLVVKRQKMSKGLYGLLL